MYYNLILGLFSVMSALVSLSVIVHLNLFSPMSALVSLSVIVHLNLQLF